MFTVYTDHKVLVSLFKSRVLNRHLQGWMLQLLDFDFTIVYCLGMENADVDVLSRQSWSSTEGDLLPHLEGECSLHSGRCGDAGTPHESKEKVKREDKDKE